MENSVVPKLGVEAGGIEQAAHFIRQSVVKAFDETILSRRIRASGFGCISIRRNGLKKDGGPLKFATLVGAKLSLHAVFETIAFEEDMKKLDGWFFSFGGEYPCKTGVPVNNQQVANVALTTWGEFGIVSLGIRGFAVDIRSWEFGRVVDRFDEAEIGGELLTKASDRRRFDGRDRAFLHFSKHAREAMRGAFGIVGRKLRDTQNVVMELVEHGSTWMAKTLVPQEDGVRKFLGG